MASQPPALHRLVGFGRSLRAAGLPVGTGRVLAFCRAAAALDPFDREDLRLAARATLVSRHADLPVVDALFHRYFEDGAAAPDETFVGGVAIPTAEPNTRVATGEEPLGIVVAASWRGANAGEKLEGESAIRVVASDAEVLRRKDFADLTDDEHRAALALVRRLAFAIPSRHSRRYRASPSGDRLDFRRTIRQSLRTEGEPFRRRWKARRTRPRPLVLILDVSGSMAPYSRPLVEFAHAAVRAGRKVEVFCFGTRLTRITRAVRSRHPGDALASVGAAVTDWEGGTRIGESLRELLDGWASRSALRGSVVVLCSDGLERGDPELLARQMQRLARLAHRLVWVNPLKGSPRYEPLARGMAASLPFVDVFLPGHDLESLEALSAAVALA
jgi:uncharacterized protein